MRHFLAGTFVALVLFPLCCLARPQESPPPVVTTTTCSYSCPPNDNSGFRLISKVDAIGYDSAYSIFECVYVLFGFFVDATGSFALNSRRYRDEMVGGVEKAQTCFYYKVSMPHTCQQSTRGRWDFTELRIESPCLTSIPFLPHSSSPMHSGFAARFLQHGW